MKVEVENFKLNSHNKVLVKITHRLCRLSEMFIHVAALERVGLSVDRCLVILQRPHIWTSNITCIRKNHWIVIAADRKPCLINIYRPRLTWTTADS